VQFLKRRLIFKNIVSGIFSSVVVWALDKHTCGSLLNFIILLALDFSTLDQIGHMSLNGLRRRVVTHDC
jgi:hypothetical protein